MRGRAVREKGVTVNAQQSATAPNTHIPYPHFTDEEDRFGIVRNSLIPSVLAKSGVEPGLFTSAFDTLATSLPQPPTN